MFLSVIYRNDEGSKRSKALYECVKVQESEAGADPGCFYVYIYDRDGGCRHLEVNTAEMDVFVLNDQGKTVEILNRVESAADRRAAA